MPCTSSSFHFRCFPRNSQPTATTTICSPPDYDGTGYLPHITSNGNTYNLPEQETLPNDSQQPLFTSLAHCDTKVRYEFVCVCHVLWHHLVTCCSLDIYLCYDFVICMILLLQDTPCEGLGLEYFHCYYSKWVLKID